MNNPDLFQAEIRRWRYAICATSAAGLSGYGLQVRCCVGIFDERLPIHSIRRWRLPPYGCAFG